MESIMNRWLKTGKIKMESKVKRIVFTKKIEMESIVKKNGLPMIMLVLIMLVLIGYADIMSVESLQDTTRILNQKQLTVQNLTGRNSKTGRHSNTGVYIPNVNWISDR